MIASGLSRQAETVVNQSRSLILLSLLATFPVAAQLPHLMDYQGDQRCSICKMPFPSDAQPSQDEAFAEHVRRSHRLGQTTEDLSQTPVRIVKRAATRFNWSLLGATQARTVPLSNSAASFA